MERNLRWLALGSAVRASGLSLILPYIALYLRNELGVGYAEIGGLVALLGVAPLAVYPFGGAIADRFGRRSLFLAAIAAEAASVLATGAAMRVHLLPAVLAAAASVSFSGSLGGPALSAYVADLAAGSERTRGFTGLRIGWNVGFTLGVLSGGVLIGFLGFASVGLLAGGVLVGGTAFLAGALGPSPYDEGLARRTGPPASAERSRRGGAVVRDRLFLAVCATFAVAYLSVNQWGTIFPLYANTVLGIPYALVGVGLALNGVLVVVAQAPTTRAALGHRHTSLFALGVLLYVAGFVAFGLFALLPGLVVLGFLASVVVLTMGENVLSIPASTLPSNLATEREIGAYNGAFFALTGAGQVLATTFGGWVLAFGAAAPVTWVVLMVPAVPALVVGALYLAPRLPPGPNRA